MSPKESMEWRRYAIKELQPGIQAIDPTRDTPDIVRQSTQEGEASHRRLKRLVHGKTVVARDRFDVTRCDLVLANFMGAEEVSIGSVGEIFWADMLRKLVIVVREESSNPHDHDMINDIADWIFHDLDEALEKTKLLISPERFS